MMGQYVADQVAAEIRTHGEPMTLKRTGQPDLPVYGKRYGARGDEITEDIALTGLNVIISNAEIAASALTTPPRKGDRLVIAGRQYAIIEDADTRVDAGVGLQHRLLVK